MAKVGECHGFELFRRFRDTVEASLESHRPDVVELHQGMTPAMETIQNCILEIMEACLKELQKTNLVTVCGDLLRQLDVGDLTLEDGLFKEFDQIVRSQLDSVWQKTGPKTKQLVKDLQSLRKLLLYGLFSPHFTSLQLPTALRLRNVLSIPGKREDQRVGAIFNLVVHG